MNINLCGLAGVAFALACMFLVAIVTQVAAEEEAGGRADEETAAEANAADDGEEEDSDAGRALDEALALERPPDGESGEQDEYGGALRKPLEISLFELVDLSLILNMSAGGSSADDETLAKLQGGNHDPRRSGFTLQGLEIALDGIVDPHFQASTIVVFLEDEVELEEAFLTTTSLGSGFEIKAGSFFTEFGRVNATHAHQWGWLDQPFTNTRIFSGDGMRGPGVRVAYLLPSKRYSRFYFTIQNPDSDTMISFRGSGHTHGDEEHNDHNDDEQNDHDDESDHEDDHELHFDDVTIGGRPVAFSGDAKLGDFLYSFRWENSFPMSEGESLFGLSYATGPNLTGCGGRTDVFGADFTLKWRPENNFRGWPFVTWENEYIRRDFKASGYFDDHDPDEPIELMKETLRDWGLRSQVLYGFRYGWIAGLRFEHGSGGGESLGGRMNDPLRDNRTRISPLLIRQLSEFSRLRLQYNYDKADHVGRAEHSIWLGVEVALGKHAAHEF